MLKQLKVILGITDNIQDLLLKTIIDQCEQLILLSINKGRAETDNDYIESIPDALESVHFQCALAMYNRLGDEGAKSVKDSDFSVEYDDVFKSYEFALKPYRRTLRTNFKFV